MKNTICEKLMWSAMTPAIFKYIAANCKNMDTFRVKKKSRKNFKDMLERTPDIGGFTKNPLRICLSGGIVWMAVYKAMDGAMSHEQFGEMVTATMQAPLIKKAFGSKNPFDMEYQKKKDGIYKHQLIKILISIIHLRSQTMWLCLSKNP